jgi:hypothetical protein
MLARCLLLLAACAAGVRGARVNRDDAFASGYSERSRAPPCVDTQPGCADWAAADECELNPGTSARKQRRRPRRR